MWVKYQDLCSYLSSKKCILKKRTPQPTRAYRKRWKIGLIRHLTSTLTVASVFMCSEVYRETRKHCDFFRLHYNLYLKSYVCAIQVSHHNFKSQDWITLNNEIETFWIVWLNLWFFLRAFSYFKWPFLVLGTI